MRQPTSVCLILFGALMSGSANGFTATAPQRTFAPTTTLPLHRQAVAPLRMADSAEYATRVESSQQEVSSTTTAEEDPQLCFLGDATLAVQELERSTNSFNQKAMINGGIIGSLFVFALYQLVHVHVGALLALSDYGLGPTDTPEMTFLSVSLQTMARMPLDLVKAYEELVPTNPIFFKACTSGVAYGLGDFISQIVQGKKLDELDLPRAARSGAAGFIAHGPLCHYWLLFMETYLDFDGAWWATGLKVTADLTVWSIFLNAAYSTIIGLLAFKNPVDVLQDVKATQWPALRSAWRFWPFVHTISFSHAVPLDLKLLWVDVMEVVWVTILSKVNNEDKTAKATANAEVAAELDNSNCQSEACLMMEQQQQQQQEPDALEIPKKVLGACWPLIAMWPVLYAGYQVEHALGLVQ